ncbi:MAG: NAD-dependent epimerase/dehydratase family protein [Candidatus Dormibacteria bacterium]
MRALVTGGAGFIGSHLAEALLGAGHEVTVIDDLSRGRRSQVPVAARFVQADVTGDLGGVLGEVRPEIVFHEAAQIDVRRSLSDPLLDTRINVLGTVNLLQACVGVGVRRVVFASSGGAIYGDTEVIPTPESHPQRPASNYGAAKAAAELYGGVCSHVYGVEFVALRYSNVYGPRQDPHSEAGVVAIFTERLLKGEVPTINGDGTQTRDYVYVADVVAANLAAISAPAAAYNVATGTECDVNELHRRLARIIGISTPATHGPAKPGEQRRSCLDTSLAASRLGWRPTFSLDAGLEATVTYFRDRAQDYL